MHILDTHLLLITMALVYTAAFICIGYILLTYRTSHAAWAWILGLIAFPYVTLILFGFFGRNHFQGYVAARRSGSYELRPIARQIQWPEVPVDHFIPSAIRPLCVLANTPILNHNHTVLHADGQQAFKAMFAAIENAEQYILLQFYIVRDDTIGSALQERLLAKLSEGVKVYFLYDDWGSAGIANHYMPKLNQAGAQSSPFNTPRRYLRRLQLNFRNHRKLLICDGICGFIGGYNIGDEYLGNDPNIGTWRDTQLEIQGPAVTALQLCFMEDWYWATNQIPDLIWNPSAPALDKSPHHSQNNTAPCPVLIVPSSAADDAESCTLLFLTLINAAQERLWIATPYFVPDTQIIHALQLATMRGVDVRIIVPAKPDHRTIYFASQTFLDSAVQFGATVYQYQPGFLHQKVFLVDQQCAAVGTANLDNRSMRLNFEISAVGFGQLFLQTIESQFEHDFAYSEKLSPSDYQNSSLPFKLLCRSARLLAPLL